MSELLKVVLKILSELTDHASKLCWCPKYKEVGPQHVQLAHAGNHIEIMVSKASWTIIQNMQHINGNCDCDCSENKTGSVYKLAYRHLDICPEIWTNLALILIYKAYITHAGKLFIVISYGKYFGTTENTGFLLFLVTPVDIPVIFWCSSITHCYDHKHCFYIFFSLGVIKSLAARSNYIKGDNSGFIGSYYTYSFHNKSKWEWN